ncbi:MAG: DUF4885 family protein [Bacteroidota bacterium]
MRCVNNGPLNYGINGYYNQDNLISIMNKKADQKQSHTSMSNLDPLMAAASTLNADKGVYDPKTGTWSSSGNLSVALQNLEDRKVFNQIINNALTKEGIRLSSKEKLTLTIDKDGQITVSGINDQEKKAKIEKVLNESLKDIITGLTLHIESVKTMNGKQELGVLEKWMVYDFLKDEAGQDLSELKLVDGEIVGANEQLQQILNGEKDFGEDNEYVAEIVTKLKSILAYGVDKIPDLEQKIDFQNGSLIDIDSSIGFGPDQLKTWFASLVSGKAQWDAKA